MQKDRLGIIMELCLLFFLYKKEEKRIYDMKYCLNNVDEKKKQHSEYYQRTKVRDKDKHKAYRVKRRSKHTEYCRERYRKDEDYRQKNRDFLWKRKYGEYWEAMKLARDITDFFRQEVPDRYERLKLKGKYLKYNEKKKLKRLLSA